jgi:hypothetical protein
VVVRQVPHEETHNASHDKTGKKLAEAQQMERHSRVVRWRGLRATVERLEHVGRVIVRDVGDGYGGALLSSTVVGKMFYGNALRCWYGFLTSVMALSAER